jgi:hypothetical protein
LKTFKRISKVFGLTLGFVVILTTIAGLRLFWAPVDINYFVENIRQSVEQAMPGLTVSFEEAYIEWNTTEDSLDLRLETVKFSNVEAGFSVDIPAVTSNFDYATLRQGVFSPNRVDLIGLDGEVNWSALEMEQKLNAFLGGAPAPNSEVKTNSADSPFTTETESLVELRDATNSQKFTDIINLIIKNPGGQGALSNLKRVNILDVELTLTEQTSGGVWQIPESSIRFSRTPYGVSFELQLNIQLGEQITQLKLASENLQSGKKLLTINFDNLHPAKLAKSVDLKNKQFELLDLPLFGAATVVHENWSTIDVIDFDLSTGNGRLVMPGLYPEAPRVDTAATTGTYIPKDRELRFDSFYALFGGAELRGDGIYTLPKAEGLGSGVQLHANLTEISTANLVKYWPASLGRSGHEWVSNNMKVGLVKNVNFVVNIRPEDKGIRPLHDHAFAINFDFENITADYLSPMTPLTNGNGIGFVGPNTLSLEIQDGLIGDILVTDSLFKIIDMGVREKIRAEIDINANGAITYILELIRQKPLNLTSNMNIKPDQFYGTGQSLTRLAFPLKKNLTSSEIFVNVEATVNEVAIPSLLPNGGLTDGNINLSLNNKGLIAKGRAKLKGVDFNLTWQEQFGLPAGSDSSRYDLEGDLTAADIEKFFIPIDDYIKGNMHARLTFLGSGGKLKRGTGIFDFFETEVDVWQMGWDKPVNTPGIGTVVFEWNDDKTLDIKNIQIAAEGMSASASLSIDNEKGQLNSINITKFEGDYNDLALKASIMPEGGYDILIEAKKLDVRPYLDTILSPKSNPDKPQLKLDIRAQKAMALNDVEVNNFLLQALDKGDYWQTATISGRFNDGGEMFVSLSPTSTGRDIVVKTTDAGNTLLGSGLFVNALGGDMDLVATIAGVGADVVAKGTLKVKKFKLVKSSLVVEALKEVKGKVIDKYIDDDGLTFDELVLPFKLQNNVFDFTKSRANGASMGFTMEGQIDREMSQINVNGLIIPAYALNSLIANIPILGNILVGGKGEGLFAITYRVKGEFDDPKVTFNPLSVFVPGILRELFEGRKGEIDKEKPKKQEKPKAKEGKSPN